MIQRRAAIHVEPKARSTIEPSQAKDMSFPFDRCSKPPCCIRASQLAMEPGLQIDKQIIVKSGSTTIKVPSEVLLELEDGRTFLKLRPSHFAIVKIICPQVKEKNFSLASGDKMKQLQTMVQEAVASKLEGFQSARAQESGEQELFAGAQAKKKRRLQGNSLADQPISLDVAVQGKMVTFLWPSKGMADIAVLLEVDHLGPVVEFLATDCEICKVCAKRTYNKSGNFSKK